MSSSLSTHVSKAKPEVKQYVSYHKPYSTKKVVGTGAAVAGAGALAAYLYNKHKKNDEQKPSEKKASSHTHFNPMNTKLQSAFHTQYLLKSAASKDDYETYYGQYPDVPKHHHARAEAAKWQGGAGGAALGGGVGGVGGYQLAKLLLDKFNQDGTVVPAAFLAEGERNVHGVTPNKASAITAALLAGGAGALIGGVVGGRKAYRAADEKYNGDRADHVVHKRFEDALAKETGEGSDYEKALAARPHPDASLYGRLGGAALGGTGGYMLGRNSGAAVVPAMWGAILGGTVGGPLTDRIANGAGNTNSALFNKATRRARMNVEQQYE